MNQEVKDNSEQHKQRFLIWAVLIVLIVGITIWGIIYWQNIKFWYYSSMLSHTGTEWSAVVDDSMAPSKPFKDESAKYGLEKIYSQKTRPLFLKALRDPSEHVKVREVAIGLISSDLRSQIRHAKLSKQVKQGMELLEEFEETNNNILFDKQCAPRLRSRAAGTLYGIVNLKFDLEAVLPRQIPQARINHHARLMELFGIYCGILMDDKADPALRREAGEDMGSIMEAVWKYGLKATFVDELEHLRPLLRSIVLDSKQEERVRLKCLDFLKDTSEELVPLYLFILRDRHFHFIFKEMIYDSLYFIAKKRNVNFDFGPLGIPSKFKWENADKAIKWADAIEKALNKSKKDKKDSIN